MGGEGGKGKREAVWPLRPVYRVYTHVDAAFVPFHPPVNAVQARDATFDPTTAPPPLSPPLPRLSPTFHPLSPSSLASNLSALQRGLDAAVSALLPFQVYGPAWNASSLPPVLWGAPALPLHFRPNASLSPTQWLRAAQYHATGPLNSPLSYPALLALAASSPTSIHFASADLIARAVAAVDFYAHQQGVDGAFASPHTHLPWCGAPHRRLGCGAPHDGYGPYSLALAVTRLLPALQAGGWLDAEVDGELDGRWVTRRVAWAAMFARAARGGAARGRVDCPSDDLRQLLGIGAAEYAAAALGARAPVGYGAIERWWNESVGYAPQRQRPADGPFYTHDGWVMECRGVEGGGGVDFTHGVRALEALTDLTRLAADMGVAAAPAYAARLEALANHLLRFAFPRRWTTPPTLRRCRTAAYTSPQG